MTARRNRRIVLAARPPGVPRESDFELVDAPMPEPGPGEVLVRGIYLSLDPYMRGRMRDAKSYTPPTALGDVMPGGVVGKVMASNDPDFGAGDIVEGALGWQEFAVSEGKALRPVDPALAPISTALGILGMPGMTAYFALLEIGRPKAGETVVVSAAAGAVGGLVGQIAKIEGCRAVGIAGSDAKCGYVTDELGFDAAINYKTAGDLDAALTEACPGGVDVYFDGVGGAITDAVLGHINLKARIVICGQISQYNLEKPEMGPRNLRILLVNRARMEGFLVFDYADRYPEGLARMSAWLRDGRLEYREDIVEGLERAPAAFIGLLQGRNFGKQLVKLADETP